MTSSQGFHGGRKGKAHPYGKTGPVPTVSSCYALGVRGEAAGTVARDWLCRNGGRATGWLGLGFYFWAGLGDAAWDELGFYFGLLVGEEIDLGFKGAIAG